MDSVRRLIEAQAQLKLATAMVAQAESAQRKLSIECSKLAYEISRTCPFEPNRQYLFTHKDKSYIFKYAETYWEMEELVPIEVD